MPLTRSISFWSQWVIANALGELVGLGAVAAAGYILISTVGEPQGISQVLIMALFFVVVGSFEGCVLGYAQAKVLALRVPALEGWIKATIVGAVVAWALGMTPSTIMSILEPNGSTSRRS